MRADESGRGRGYRGGADKGRGIKGSAGVAKQRTNKLSKIPTCDSRHVKAAVYPPGGKLLWKATLGLMVASSTWLKDEASLWQRRQHQQQQQQHCLFSAPSANMHCTLSCTLLSLSGMKNLAGINMACEFWSNSPCSFFFFFIFLYLLSHVGALEQIMVLMVSSSSSIPPAAR